MSVVVVTALSRAAAPVALAAARGAARRRVTTIVRSAARRAADAMDIALPSGRRIRDALRAPPPASLAHLSRTGADSLLSTALPFRSDAALRAASVNAAGHLRVGLLFEELDAFAGAVAYAYCDAGGGGGSGGGPGGGEEGLPTLVTASMDRVDLLRYPLHAETDLVLRGAVTATGASSMNIDVDLLDAADGAPVMQASLTFVARGRGNAAVPVPVLRPAGAAQVARAAAGRAAMAARRAARAASLLVAPPTPDELALVHTLFTERAGGGAAGAAGAGGGAGGAADAAPRFTSDTAVTTTDITMPTDTNVHGKVFGGWLLRRAFEAAYAAGWRFTGVPPKFLALDDVTFLAPVEVGAILRLDARVTYSLGAPHRTYQVGVTAAMATPGRALAGGAGRDSMATNEFSFTFHTGDAAPLPRVYPRSYADAMLWIAASRRANVGRALADARKAGGGPRARFTDDEEAEAAAARAQGRAAGGAAA